MKRHLSTAAATRTRESRTLPGERDDRRFFSETFVPGAAAGLIGGALMLLLYGLFSTAHGTGFFALPKMIAGMFWRDLPTLAMPGTAILVGLFVHFNVAVAVGVTWSLIVPRRRRTLGPATSSPGTALVPLTLLFVSLVYVVLNFFVVEFISPPMRRELMRGAWGLAHLVFGLTLALVMVPVRESRWVARHRAREVPVRGSGLMASGTTVTTPATPATRVVVPPETRVHV